MLEFNNPTTTPKTKTQRKTKNKPKHKMVDNDPYCRASTTTKEKKKTNYQFVLTKTFTFKLYFGDE